MALMQYILIWQKCYYINIALIINAVNVLITKPKANSARLD